MTEEIAGCGRAGGEVRCDGEWGTRDIYIGERSGY